MGILAMFFGLAWAWGWGRVGVPATEAYERRSAGVVVGAGRSGLAVAVSEEAVSSE